MPADPDAGDALEVAKATLASCEWDLEREEDRMSTIDGKLTALASFAGVSLSITGGLGGSVLATNRLPAGFAIALAAAFAVSVALLLAGVITAFLALSPKLYDGVEVDAVVDRVVGATEQARTPTAVLLSLAGTRAKVLGSARKVNNRKARAATRGFLFTSAGLSVLVAGVLVVAVGSLL